MAKQFYVYILTNDYKTTFYFIYYECYPDAKTAIAREKQIKLWRREKKVLLIENTNPDWRDLSEEW